MLGADWSRLGYSGRSSPTPSGVAEDDRDSSSGSVDLDRDDSFRAVFHFIREFHSMEEPASVAPNRCKTSLAPIYGLQLEPSQALHLPLFPLLQSLLEDTNLGLSKFVEDQTVHGFLPFPGHRHWRYYRTSFFPGPYTVPNALASITLDKGSESRKHSVSLSPKYVSRLLQSSFPGGKGDGGLASCDRPLSPERVCSANSVQEEDRSLRTPVRQRGGFPSSHRPEGRLFPDTRSSVIEEAIEVPVGKDSLSVQGPVLRTVDCPSGLHLGVCSCICVGALPRGSSSQVPG